MFLYIFLKTIINVLNVADFFIIAQKSYSIETFYMKMSFREFGHTEFTSLKKMY